MKIKAIIFGATGMVGEGVLLTALRHPGIDSVLVVGRRPCGISHPALKEIIHSDFFDYSSIERELAGYNACFFCLGVSSVGMKEKEYTRVTFDLTIAAATILSGVNPQMTFCYVSGAGTDSSERGRLMWARVKGRTENTLMKLPFKAVYLFRPGFIKPLAGQKRAYPFAKVLGAMYPFWKILMPGYVCTLDDLGNAMIASVVNGYPKPILENVDIGHIAAGPTGAGGR